MAAMNIQRTEQVRGTVRSEVLVVEDGANLVTGAGVARAGREGVLPPATAGPDRPQGND